MTVIPAMNTLWFCFPMDSRRALHGTSADVMRKYEVLLSRLVEVHFSPSTMLLGRDPYEDFGFRGYRPFHALFSVIREKASSRTKRFMSGYPVVVEGVVPPEDTELAYLKQEMDMLR